MMEGIEFMKKKTIYVTKVDKVWYRDELEESRLGIAETLDEAINKLAKHIGEDRHFFPENWDEIEVYTYKVIEHNGQTFVPITLNMNESYWSEYSGHELIGEKTTISEDIRKRLSYIMAKAELDKKITNEETKEDEQNRLKRLKKFQELEKEFGENA